MSRLSLGLLLAFAGSEGDLQDEARPAPAQALRSAAELRPGLVAVYRSLAPAPGDLPLSRIDAKPAFTWGRSSPHPRIAPGPFEATWTGVFLQPEADSLRFSAALGGAVKVTIGGVVVLEGRGERETSWIEPREPWTWKPGAYPIRIEYRSLADVPARLQLWWEGRGFSKEPLPPWRLKHVSDEAAEREKAATLGRAGAAGWGCVQCHRSAFPALPERSPGPSLRDLGERLPRAWLLRWLEDPAKAKPGARMPALFAPDRSGFVERWVLADHLLAGAAAPPLPRDDSGDPRQGRAQFASLGCATCHPVPDLEPEAAPDPDRTPLEGLSDRMSRTYLAAFLRDPAIRYPDGRMPRIPMDQKAARDIAAYLLSAPAAPPPAEAPPAPGEIRDLARRLGVADAGAAAKTLLERKGCLQCHPGETKPLDLPIRRNPAEAWAKAGCLSGRTLPRFEIPPAARRTILSYLEVAGLEKHPSPFAARQELLERRGCRHCHSRDTDLPPPIEVIGGRVGTEVRQHRLPFQRVPRLTHALSKYRKSYLLAAIRDGVSGVRPDWYSYRMPAYGSEAEEILRALAEGEGALPDEPEKPPAPVADPVAHVEGPVLVGFEGYSCITCHLWKKESMTNPDPGAVGPELTTVAQRIRRDWFERWLEDPARAHPGTPMPAVFRRGQPAPIRYVYGGDAEKQKEAIWDYLSRGKDAITPRSPPPIPVEAPVPGSPPLVAHIPIGLDGRSLAEGLCVLFPGNDLVVYDLGGAALHGVYTGGQIQRKSRPRSFLVAGTPASPSYDPLPAFRLVTPGGRENPSAVRFRGYERLPDGVRIRLALRFPSGSIEATDTVRVSARALLRQTRLWGVPAGSSVELRTRPFGTRAVEATGEAQGARSPEGYTVTFARSSEGTIRYELPPAGPPPKAESPVAAGAARLADAGKVEGSLERPGYRAIAYPRPATLSGEDRVMPYALAVDPRDGSLYIASVKLGEVFRLRDPHDDGRDARFEDFAGGLYQEAYGMAHDGEALVLLHRRNLTRIRDADGDGLADRFDRVAGGAEWPADSRAFGLLRDRTGAFWLNAGDTKKAWPGSAAALRLTPGEPAAWEDAAFGLRQVYGWCLDSEDRIFFTDNQGEWVATNKLCHLVPGRFYGYRNPEKPGHFTKPPGKAAVWIPYGWAKSINGLDLDRSGGRFGPFAGQFFMAELMYGGGLFRAHLEEVEGEFQGACFPFWGKGLLGPLVLAFDPKGRLFVGGITEAECGAQPDRGALYRIDFTGETPFEILRIHALPRGFRLVFTGPVDPATARDRASYSLEHYRYEYTGAYGSPELDRTHVAVERVRLAEDGRSVDLETGPLVKDRVYLVQARGIRSPEGKPLVHPLGAYTLNAIPSGR